MSKFEINKTVLIDADVFRHFYLGKQLVNLIKILPYRFAVTSEVQTEIFRQGPLKSELQSFLNMGHIDLIDFNKIEIAIQREFAYLHETMGLGNGESSCMAYALYKKEYIASSNLKDISEYCEQKNIPYFTTTDLLRVAVQRKIITTNEANKCIADILNAGSKMPVETIEEYRITNRRILAILNEIDC